MDGRKHPAGKIGGKKGEKRLIRWLMERIEWGLNEKREEDWIESDWWMVVRPCSSELRGLRAVRMIDLRMG